MSGGGGFRGRGFASHGHHRQSSNGPGVSNSRGNGPNIRSGGIQNSRLGNSRNDGSGFSPNVQGGEHVGPNSRPDGPNSRLGSPNFRGGGGSSGSSHGPRPNFNLPRRPPRHPGPAPNWNSPRGASPHFTPWRGGRPPRFDSPPRPFYQGRGQNNFGQYRYPYMSGNFAPIMLDFPAIPETKSTPLLGSEEERLQKITEAADELKRKLSVVPNGPAVWYNENGDDAMMDFTSDKDCEPRISSRGKGSELKHDPPELDSTLNDLRDIGRMDHDLSTKQAKANSDNASNSSSDDTEVEILDYSPVQPDTIDIDVWSDDNAVECEEGDSDDKTREQLEPATETMETSQNSICDKEQNPVAEMANVDSIADENISRDANTNEDSQELTKKQNPEEEVLPEVEITQRKDDENQKPETDADKSRDQDETATKMSDNNVQNTRIEDNLLLEESKTGSDEDREKQNEKTNPSEENENAASNDKKVEDVQIELHDVNVNKTIIELSEESMLTEKETRNESVNESCVDLESAIRHAGTGDVAESSLDGNENTKESANVRDLENESSSAMDESRDNPETAIVTNETKNSDKQKQTSSEEITSEVRKDNTSLEISQETLTDLQDEKTSSLSIDSEKNKEQQQQNVITENSHNVSVIDEIKVSKDKREEPQKERQGEKSKTNAKKDETGKKNEESVDASCQLEILKNRNNSNGKTEVREKTENLAKIDSSKNPETEKKSVNKHEPERSSLRDEIIDDPKSPMTDGKTHERRKLVRKKPENIPAGPRNRRAVRTDSPVHSPQRTPRVDFGPCESSSVIFDPRAPPPARPQYGNNNCRIAKPSSPEISQMNPQIPPAFDPRLSMHERSALIASAPIPIGQDPFGMAPGYPLVPMTNFVPNVPTINYGVPRAPMIGAPIEPPPMHLPDSFTPLMSLPPNMTANMPPSIPLTAESTMMIQPPLPIEPPPPPPPPAKSSNLDMVDELEDMQEAMEFAKKFMNMADVSDINDVDDSVDANFFHMPTFPDLPPIELPPLPPPEISPPSPIPPPPSVTPLSEELENIVSRSRQQSSTSNKDCRKNAKHIKRETLIYGPQLMPEESRISTSSAGERFEDPSHLNDDTNRPKVIFNLNSKISKFSKPEVFQQNDGDNAEDIATSQPRNKLSALPAPVHVNSAIQEKLRLANGRNERETTRLDGKPSRFNGIINFPLSKKPEETSQSKYRSRSPSPSKRDKNSKDERSNSTLDKSERSSRRGSKDTSSKKSKDSGNLEASWKSRVIGRFLKMSKNDICNMLNNASLRKFDIAMKHLVKERRSSLSLEMRNNEEEKMKGAEVSYNREEFMDQLSAMLDPSATVDVCNLPTQFIHHLSEVLQLDSTSDFEAALTPSESVETSSPTPVQPPPSVARIPRASSANVKEIDDRMSAQKGRDKKSMRTSGSAVETTVASNPASTPATIPTTPAATRKVGTRTCDDSVQSKCVKNAENEETIRATPAPRAVARRSRGRPVNVEVQDSMTVNNGATNRNNSNSVNMADLDDIFSPGIAREKKKLSSGVTVVKNDKRTGDANLSASAGNNEVAKDSSVDRVERAAVELDKIFTAGIARFKLPSIKAPSAATRVGEVNDGDDDDDEEDDWHHGEDRNARTGINRPRQRTRCRSFSKGDKWNRRKAGEDRDAFRNLTKEEWDAKYGESSYASYEQEYRAMAAMRARRYEATQENEAITDVRTRLGNQVAGDSGIYEAWSGSDDGARFRNMNDPMTFEIHAYNRSSGGGSSSSNSMSSSSDSSDEESQTAPSVTKLLKVIKAKEKIAKQKSLNEEIRDEVAAEIEKNRRERGKVHKSRHKSKVKKNHRRKKDRKEKTRERKKKGRKRRRRRSRRSGSDSRDSSADSGTDEDEYTSSASRSRKSSRILTENEIKKEIIVKEEPEYESLPSTQAQRRSKSSLAVRSIDESRPPSTSSSSSMPAVAVTSTSASSSATNYLKTKAQLKQMPVVNAPKVAATATVVSKDISQSQELPAGAAKETPRKIVAATSSAVVETPSIVKETVSSPLPSSSISSGSSSVQIQPALNTSDEPISTSKPTTKKLDIKAYKERARQRQIQETERLRQITENPIILTQNLLNISLERKKVSDSAENAVESGKQVEDRKIDGVEKLKSTSIPTTTTCNLTIICTTSNSRTVISTTTSPRNVICTTSSPRTVFSTTTNPVIVASSATSPQTVISTTTPTTTMTPRIDAATPSHHNTQKIPPATSSPLTIISTNEATKVSVSQEDDSQSLPSKNVTPRKLVRKRSLTKDPKIAVEPATHEECEEAGKFAHIKSEGSKEMKLREKPKKSKPRTPVKGLESTIEPIKPARVRKRSSVSSRTSTEEVAVFSSEKSGEDQAIVPADKNIEEQVTSTSEKSANELAAISSEKSANELAAISSEKSADESAAIPSDKSIVEPADFISGVHEKESAQLTAKQRGEESTELATEKSTDELAVTHSEQSAEETEIYKAEKCADEIAVSPAGDSTEDPEVISSEKSKDDLAAIPVEKSAEILVEKSEEILVEKSEEILVEKSTEETAAIPVDKSIEESAPTPPEKSAEESPTISLEKPPEEATSLTSAKKTDIIESKSNDSDFFKKQLNSEDYLPTLDTTEKLDDDLVPESELDPLAMRISDLPDWSLDESISPNAENELNDSGDDPPFRGFTKDSIILQDRVLTEAEENIAEMDRLGKVPLTFVDDPDTSTGGGLDLDDVTSTGVSLDAPQSYGDEEFVESGVETSLLGFPVENDINDETENQIALGSENDRVNNDIDESTVNSFIEETSQETTETLPRVTPTLSVSPAPDDDFLVEDVRRAEFVPSPILVAELSRVESTDLSPMDKVDECHSKENTVGSPINAAEVSTSHERENKETAGTSFLDAETLAMDMGSLQSSAVQDEKEIFIQMEKIKKIDEEKSDILPEFEEKLLNKLDVIKDPIQVVVKEVNESPSRNNTPVDLMLAQPSQQERANDIVEKTNEEITTEKLQIAEEPRATEAKTRNSHRGESSFTTKEHSHSRSKRKSSRHRNNAPKTGKKSTLTEKMVEEAISTNIVKLVPKPSSKESVLARMVEIDVEIHKLMNEKMTLYTMLQSGDFPVKDSSGEESSSSNKSNDDTKSASEREEPAISDIAPPIVLASHLARNLDKTVLITPSRAHDSKKVNSELDGKTMKRKKSPARDLKHRSKESDGVEIRRERKDSESKNQSRRTASEEITRRESSLKSFSREKSCSSTDLDDASENRRKRKEKFLDSSNRQSSKEDLKDSSRDSADRSVKSVQHEDSPKRDKEKKKNKTLPAEKKIEEPTKVRKDEEEKSNAVPPKTTKKISAVIYSDESTWDSLDPESIPSDEQRAKKDGTSGNCTGLALLEETFKREMAQTRKLKAVEKRKNKKQELRRILLDVTGLTPDEEEIPLSDLYHRKNAQKKSLIESKGKSGVANESSNKVSKHITSVIDAVAADRVEQLYTGEVSSISDEDSTPASSLSLRGCGTDIERERSPSISVVESIGERSPADSLDKAKPVESETAQRKNAEANEFDQSKSEEVPESKISKKSKKNDENNISEPKLSEIEKAASESERSSPVEVRKKKRYISSSSGASTPDIPDIDTSARKNSQVNAPGEKRKENEKLSGSVEKSAKKNGSTVQREKESGSRVAEASRSPSPGLPRSASQQSKSVDTKLQAKEKHKYENSISKEKSSSELSTKKSAEKNQHVHSTKGTNDERSRSNSRNEHPFKRRSVTPRETGRERERKERHSSRDADSNDREDKSSGRPKSSTKRRHRDKSASLNRRHSRHSEERVKRSRSKKRDRERSDSRGTSPHDSESSRKKQHRSHRSSSPKASSVDDQARRRGRKRKAGPEISREAMMNCKVQLIDCKYTYLSPNMNPRVLKKFGISRINPYVAPILVAESMSSSPQFVRAETPSPPTLSKIEVAKPLNLSKNETAKPSTLTKFEAAKPSTMSKAETAKPSTMSKAETAKPSTMSKVEVSKPSMLNKVEVAKTSTLSKIEIAKPSTLNKVEVSKQKVKEASPPKVIHNHEEENRYDEDKHQDGDDEAENEDVVDEAIHYIKVTESSDTPVIIDQDEDTDIPEIIDETSCPAESALPDVISIEDETTDEIDPKNDSSDVIEVLNEKVASKSTEKTAEPQQKTAEPEAEEDVIDETRRTRYTVHKGPILDIKVLDDSFLAASEDGAIYRYSQTSNGILNIYKGHEAAVTCIHVLEVSPKRWNLYSGSLDGTFRCYNITTGTQDRPPADVGSPVQCMDQGWGIFYVGTKSGHISRYNIKSGSIKGDRLEFSDNSVLALKASAEGPRRVLIVASRNQPITIRDALTGLFLRTICGYKSHTVYSLMREKNLVYCGTSSTSIPVFDFTNGEQVTQFNAGVGIVCMRLYRQVLFAGCYDGNIYVFDTKESRLIISIPGPGNMLLSMEIVGDEIIAGSKNRQLHSWPMPRQVRALLSERA